MPEARHSEHKTTGSPRLSESFSGASVFRTAPAVHTAPWPPLGLWALTVLDASSVSPAHQSPPRSPLGLRTAACVEEACGPSRVSLGTARWGPRTAYRSLPARTGLWDRGKPAAPSCLSASGSRHTDITSGIPAPQQPQGRAPLPAEELRLSGGLTPHPDSRWGPSEGQGLLRMTQSSGKCP